MKLSECDKHQKWMVQKMDMTGYTFIQHALLYEVDRSIVIAERFDEDVDTVGLTDFKGMVTRLYFDTVLECPFVVIFKMVDTTFWSIHKLWWVPDCRHDLLDYCQKQFPDMLEDVMGTEFQYLDRYPSDDDILRTRYGTNNYPTTDVKRKDWRDKKFQAEREKELVTA